MVRRPTFLSYHRHRAQIGALEERTDATEAVLVHRHVEDGKPRTLAHPDVARLSLRRGPGRIDRDAGRIVIEEPAIEPDRGKGFRGIDIGVVVKDAIAAGGGNP